MQTYVANYRSPDGADVSGLGVFEFESDARMGTKANLHDARLRLLELFGKDAVSWSITKVERKTAKSKVADGQMELDFRDPKPQPKRKVTKGYW